MKSLFSTLSLLILVLLCSSCKHENNYTIEWDLSGIISAGFKIDSVNIISDDGNLQTIKTLDNGKFKATGYVDKPTIATIDVHISNREESTNANLEFILEEGNITFNPDYGCAEGTSLNDAVLDFYKNVYDVIRKDSAKKETVIKMYEDYITKHKDDISSVFVIANVDMAMAFDKSSVKKLYDMLSSDMKDTPKAKEFMKKIGIVEGTKVGNTFTDFAVEYNGKTTKLSDYVGKGKLCLVDFWASWCGPCREEIPNIKEVYEKYGDKVNVLGVACWDKPEDTEAAINELGIKYPQIINAQEIGTEAYGIEGIPEIILFSPDGKILKRGLRDAEIMKAVEDNMK